MKSLTASIILAGTLFSASAADNPYQRSIFQDDFSGSAFGPRWGHYKSGSVVKDGMLVGITPEKSDHSAVDSIRFTGERDLEVSVKFRFASAKAKSFNVWFDDKDYKGSHAGHICSVSVSPSSIAISDAKTGNFQNDLYEKQKAGTLSAEDKKLIESKRTRIPAKISLEEWHTLVTRTKGDQVSVLIDGKEAGTFKSEGISHATKSLVSLTTNPVDVHYDDFSIKGTGAAPAKR